MASPLKHYLLFQPASGNSFVGNRIPLTLIWNILTIAISWTERNQGLRASGTVETEIYDTAGVFMLCNDFCRCFKLNLWQNVIYSYFRLITFIYWFLICCQNGTIFISVITGPTHSFKLNSFLILLHKNFPRVRKNVFKCQSYRSGKRENLYVFLTYCSDLMGPFLSWRL